MESNLILDSGQITMVTQLFLFRLVEGYSLVWIVNLRENRVISLLEENITRNERINEALVEAIDSKKQFLACLSDEIRNPLNSVIGNLDYLTKMINDKN